MAIRGACCTNSCNNYIIIHLQRQSGNKKEIKNQAPPALTIPDSYRESIMMLAVLIYSALTILLSGGIICAAMTAFTRSSGINGTNPARNAALKLR